MKKVLSAIIFLLLLVRFNHLSAQIIFPQSIPPVITYPGPPNYFVGTPITPLTPSSIGGTGAEVASFAVLSGIRPFVSINGPAAGLAFDASGNLYAADNHNNLIKKISPAGVVTIFAGSGAAGAVNGTGIAASFNAPTGVAFDNSGNMYVTDAANNLIRKITPSAVVTTFAGSGAAGSANGTGAAASFNNPQGIAVDGSGNVYVADNGNSLIRKITPAGVVTTFAGSGTAAWIDGTGIAASFFSPYGLTIDAAGNLFVGDFLEIREITPAGVVSTVAGNPAFGSNDSSILGPASFNFAFGLAVDASDNVYVADINNGAIRQISAGGVITYAFTNISGGIAVDALGNVYAGDGSSVEKTTQALPAGLLFDGNSGTISGTPTVVTPTTSYMIAAFNAAGSGVAAINITVSNAPPAISYPGNPLTATTGTPFLAIPTNTGGTVFPVAGSYVLNTPLPAGLVFDDKTGIISGIPTTVSPATTYSITANNSGGSDPVTINITVNNQVPPPNISYPGPQTFNIGVTIASINPSNTGGAVPALSYGQATTLAGTGFLGRGDGADTTAASFANPAGIAVDAAGNVYVADAIDGNPLFGLGNSLIRRITPAGAVTTLIDGAAVPFNLNNPQGVTTDLQGNIYVADTQNQLIRKITAGGPAGVMTTFAGSGAVGSTNGTGAAASFNNPTGLAMDRQGNLYVADKGNNLIRKITPAGVVTTLAGSGAAGAANGTGMAASFNAPNGVTADVSGNVYVADQGNNLIRKITPAGVVTTFAGSGTAGSINGTGAAASFNGPQGVAADAFGYLYVADQGNNLIRAISPSGVVTTLSGNGTFASVNGPGTVASFANPVSVATDGQGNVYVGEAGVQNAIGSQSFINIRKINALGYAIDPPLSLGLNFDNVTGTVSGTPTAVSPATNYTVIAHNGGGSGTATVNITVNTNAAIDDASLSNLTVNSGALTPAFASGTTSYTDTVSNISSLIITPTTNNPNATVKINSTIVARDSSASIPLTAGQNTITAVVTAADGTTTKTYTITVTLIPFINAGSPTGAIIAFAGSASVSPNIQQFTVSGNGLTADITVTAPTNFEVSLAPGSGYGSSVTLNQSGGLVNTTTVYVRSAASAPTGSITGNVTLTSAGALSQNIPVTGFVNAIPTVNPVANQTVNNGAATTAVNFTGSGGFSWVNNTPGIGLAASGSGNIPSFTAINASTSPVTATITVTPVSIARGFAYIPNHDSNNVSVINTATNTVVATIPVGALPFGVAATPDGSTVYIANSGSSFISVINTNTNAVVNTIPTGTGPFTLVVSPDGSKLYAVIGNNVAVISTATNAVTDTIPIVGGNTGISISPDGSRVYVANSIAKSVTVISTASKTVIATIPVGTGPNPYPIAIAVTLDSKKVFVTNSGSNIISVIDAATNTVVSTIPAPPLSYGIVLSPDGSKAYVATFSPSVLVLNTATNTVMATIPVAANQLYGISISPDGSRVYAASLSGNVVVINTTTNTVIATIPVGALPYSLGNFVTNTTTVSGTPITFTITVNPTITSNNANLTNLTLSNGSLTPVFASGTTNYTASVGNLITAITLTPTTSSPAATVTVNGVTVASGSPSAAIPLLVGANTITTIVTAQDGTTTKTYTVTVTRAGGTTNASLTKLKISKGTLSPAFASGTFSYIANISNATTFITVTPTAADPTATITVNGATVASGSPSAGLPVAVGPNTITIVVTKDSTAVSYTLTVNRGPSENALLANLQLSKGTLSPAFASGTFSYTARAGRTTTGITVTPTTADAGATVTVNGIAVTSGTASPTIPLSAGVNNITIIVTAQNGTVSKIYSLAVTKEAGAMSSLFETVSIADGTGSDQPAADGVKVHQGVSPNGDGLNDVLLIDGITAYPENKLLIVNRNGSLIFETQGYNNITRVFDGHSNQNGAMQLPGTYFYSLEYKVGNETKHSTGFFVLKY